MIENGVARRVVIVKNPPGALFEQAIFIVKERACTATQHDITKEAQHIIDGITQRASKPRHLRRERVCAAAVFMLLIGVAVLLLLR